MSLTTTYPTLGEERANKICVTTRYASDGRSLEAFWLDYSPDDSYALFLLEFALKNAPGVESYTVYDENGSRIRRYTPDTPAQPEGN